MKLTCLTIFFAVLALTAQAKPKTDPDHKHVSVLSMNKEVFYFKLDAEFMGATVEVSDSTGTVFFSAELHDKRNLIDFFNLETGKYTIHFEHNGVIENYEVWLENQEAFDNARTVTFKLHA